MHIGISTDILKMHKDRQKIYKTALKLQKKFDISSFELEMQGAIGPFPWWWEYTPSVVKEIRDFLKNFKYKGVHLPFGSLDCFHRNPRMRLESKYQIEEAIKVSTKLGVDYVVCHPSVNLWDNKKKGELKLWKDAFVDFIQLCKKNKIIFTMEHTVTQRGIRIMKALGVEYTLDVGHANLDIHIGELRNRPWKYDQCKYSSVAEFIKEECGLITNIHVHDNHGKEDEHLPAGEGNINFPEIISVLKDKGYKGPLTMEFNRKYGMRRIEKGIEYIRDLL